jgi:hypothetical protein
MTKRAAVWMAGFVFVGGLILSAPSLATSQGSEPPHPILPIPGSGSGAEAILANYTEEQFLQFVPMQAPRGAAYGFVPAVVPGDTGWSWNAANPDQLVSTPSGTVFPNAAYQIRTEAVPVLSGRVVDVPFYLAAGSSTRKSLVFAEIDLRKRSKLRSDLLQLAAAYVRSGDSPATRDDRFARRIAVALDRWATAVPDYFMTEKNSATFISAVGFTRLTRDIQRASDHNGLAHEWNDDELLAFDAIYDSRALADLSAERGYDVRAHIKDDLFGNIGDFIADRVPVSVAIATNLSGPFTVLAQTARVLDQPAYIIWMDEYLEQTVRRKIMRDGALGEGIGYSYGYVTENLNAARQTRDYFLTRPADTAELQAIQARTGRYVGLLQFGQQQWNALRLPDGRFPSFGDTNFNGITARNTGVSGLLPAYGHLALGSGTGDQAVQLSQNFSDDSNHMRSDVTGFTLWAMDNELLGNIRYYNGTPGRQFGEQILSHNAVTIDRANMSRGSWTVGNNNHRFTSGNLTLYEPGHQGIAVSEIDGQRPYANRASRYQRLMIVNTVDPLHPYAVDVFRVTGGRTHDYTLHGAIRFDQTWETSATLTPNPAPYPMLEPGETWVEPTSSGSSFPYYGFWRDVSSGPAPGDLHVTYRDTSDADRDLRLWVTDPGAAQVHLGRTPNPERTNTEPPNFYRFWRPSLILRRRIESGTLQSLFAGVVEPFRGGESMIQSVQRLPLAGDAMEAVALRVTFVDGRTDTYVINLYNPKVAGAGGGVPSVSTADGQYLLTGRIGAHTTGPAGERSWTIAASEFRFGTGGLTTPDQTYQGVVTGLWREAAGDAADAFVTSAALPEGTALAGRQLSLTFDTYRVVNSTAVQRGLSEMFTIDHVESLGGESVVFLTQDHQLVMGASGTITEQMAPERTFEGPLTFEIGRSAAAVPITPVDEVRTPRNQSAEVSFTLGDLAGTPADTLTVTASSSNTDVVPADGLVLGGSGATRTLTLTPAPDVDGRTIVTLTATDGTHTASRDFRVTVGVVQDPPTISVIPDQLISVDGSTGPVPFIVADPDTPVDALTLTAASSNPTVIPEESIVFGGSGAERTLTVAAAPASSGASVITITASDGTGQAERSFTVTVNDAPTITPIPDQRIGVNGSTVALPFTVGDRETAPEALIVSATSANAALVPPGGLMLGGSGSERTLTVTPAANQAGTAVIVVHVTDGTRDAVAPFTLTVDAAPTISPINDRTIAEDASTGPISFTVRDGETGASSLTVTGSSSNPALVPDANIVIASAPSPWTSTDVGAVGAAGDSAAGDVFVLRASGADIWAAADEGHFLHQAASGDGEMVARVTGVQNTNVWAKAGVMFRASTAANSAHVFMLLSAANGVAFQRRLAAGGTSTSSGVTGISSPCWVRLVKAGDTFTGYYALDDAGEPGAWIQVGPSVTIASGTWLRGLAATSHNDGVVGTYTFDRVSGPADVGGNRTVTVTPAGDENGQAVITLAASDGLNTTTRAFTLSVTPVNDAPTIAALSDRTIDEDASTGPIPVIVGDIDTPLDSLVVTAASSNPALLPADGVVVGGAGAERSLTLTPAANASGMAVITVAVGDGAEAVSTAFTLTVGAVNDPPTLSEIADRTIPVNGTTGPIPFTIGDVDDRLDRLTLFAASSNDSLVPASSIRVAGSGARRTITVTPVPNRTGSTLITLSLDDGRASATEMFTVTVGP